MGIRPEMIAPLATLLERGEDKGCVNLSELNEVVQEIEPDDAELEAFYQHAQERDLEIRDDCGRAQHAESTYVNGDLNVATTDALQLFLNEAGRYPLLTAADEVEL